MASRGIDPEHDGGEAIIAEGLDNERTKGGDTAARDTAEIRE